jgi:hypothetical protein
VDCGYEYSAKGVLAVSREEDVLLGLENVLSYELLAKALLRVRNEYYYSRRPTF